MHDCGYLRKVHPALYPGGGEKMTHAARSTPGSEVCAQRGTVVRRADIRFHARDGYFQHQFTIHGQLRMNCVKVTPVHDREGAQRSFCLWLGSSATTQVGITCPDLKLTPGPRNPYFKLIPQVLFTYGPQL